MEKQALARTINTGTTISAIVDTVILELQSNSIFKEVRRRNGLTQTWMTYSLRYSTYVSISEMNDNHRHLTQPELASPLLLRPLVRAVRLVALITDTAAGGCVRVGHVVSGAKPKSMLILQYGLPAIANARYKLHSTPWLIGFRAAAPKVECSLIPQNVYVRILPDLELSHSLHLARLTRKDMSSSSPP